MPTSDSPFTETEEQKFNEISAKSQFHREEFHRLTLDLQPYRDWCSLGKPASIYSAEELQAFEALSVEAKYHSEERQACEMQMTQYRDLKNVIDYARQEGYAKGYQEGAVSRYLEGVVRRLLEFNLPIALIAQSTGLSEAEVEALQN